MWMSTVFYGFWWTRHSEVHIPCLFPACSLLIPCLFPSATMPQPCLFPSATMLQPCLFPSTTIIQPCLFPSTTIIQQCYNNAIIYQAVRSLQGQGLPCPTDT